MKMISLYGLFLVMLVLVLSVSACTTENAKGQAYAKQVLADPQPPTDSTIDRPAKMNCWNYKDGVSHTEYCFTTDEEARKNHGSTCGEVIDSYDHCSDLSATMK